MEQEQNNILGENLGRIRRKRNLTQERLAELVETSPKHISNIERGCKHPSHKMQQRLAQALEITVDTLHRDTREKRTLEHSDLNQILRTIDDYKERINDLIEELKLKVSDEVGTYHVKGPDTTTKSED